MSSFDLSKYEDKMVNKRHPCKEVSFNCYHGNMHRGETEKSMGMNMKVLHQSLMKHNIAMMPIVSIKNNNFGFPAHYLSYLY